MRAKEAVIMLIAFDRSSETDYRSWVQHVTLYPKSENILAQPCLNAHIIRF